MAPDEYRELARQCFELAQNSQDQDDKMRLLDMAQAWLDLAEKASSAETPSDPS